MSCKPHTPIPSTLRWEHDEPDTEFEHGYAVIGATCSVCHKLLLVQVAFLAFEENPSEVLGLPND